MYEFNGLQDVYFLILYGCATMYAVVAGCYLLWRRGNAFSTEVNSSPELRLWAASFMAAVVGSHVWWAVLGVDLFIDDPFVGRTLGIILDRVAFIPLMMILLLRMLQDRRRPLWPVLLATIPELLLPVVGFITRNPDTEFYTEVYTVLLIAGFAVWLVISVRQYGRWLRDNYADLENKEVWQSLLLQSFLMLTFVFYFTTHNDIFTEYVVQLLNFLIVSFVLWRVETLQELNAEGDSDAADGTQTAPVFQTDALDGKGENLSRLSSTALTTTITRLLREHCEEPRLYLRHDLTLAQLAEAVGTNRTYLSQYFTQQGITYNAYINRLRIDHFVELYRDATGRPQPSGSTVTAQSLAWQSGFKSYSTFGVAFKRFMGQTVSEWMKG